MNRWGILQFESNTKAKSKERYYEEWSSRCAAMAIYYAMKNYRDKEGKYTADIEALKPYAKQPFPVWDDADMTIDITKKGYDAKATIGSYTAAVNEERYLVVSSQKIPTSQTE